jgi:response regulator of citrate/malate metabolism
LQFPIDEVLDALQKARLSGKTIVLAAALGVERVTQYLQAGVKDVILKPYTLVELNAIFSCD